MVSRSTIDQESNEQRPTEVVERTRTTYKGPLAVGEDLMHFEVNDNGIKVFNAKKEPVKIEGL